MESLNIPVGVSDFSEIRQNNYYYIDKTGLIIRLLNTSEITNQFFDRVFEIFWLFSRHHSSARAAHRTVRSSCTLFCHLISPPQKVPVLWQTAGSWQSARKLRNCAVIPHACLFRQSFHRRVPVSGPHAELY